MNVNNQHGAPGENPEALPQGEVLEETRGEEEDDSKLLDSNWNEIVESFEDMNLKKDLLRGIFGHGFVKPSQIQQKGIKPLLIKKDTIAQAQSGTGKTATFVISCLQNIDHESQLTQALILAPTRELATQIIEVVKSLGTYLKVSTHLCTGGTQVVDDRKKLKDGATVVVGTPGRVRDLLNRQILTPAYLKMLIIDEADEMLSRGFLEQINEIMKLIPPDCQICFFSATIPTEIIKLTESIMNNPAKILIKKEEVTLEGIKQYFLLCSNDSIKYDNLFEIFSNIDVSQCIIYVNKKEKAEQLAAHMKEKQFIVSFIHGMMPQETRNQVMREFREGASRILISTDLLARGIDIHQVGLVINFDLPTNKQNYVHRIGRSGRFGKQGLAINLVCQHEVAFMLEIQEYYHTEIKPLPNDLAELS